ncbi:MAG TPA: SDR family oxidoreductase [Burkholderiales bacterium]|jgi:nucleoside-diphosphate-sugar epimerase|nr:SDR family oxidoreductase [Burkholderiales bacterium]
MKKLLIVGYGDIARRTVPHLRAHYELHALMRRPREGEPVKAIYGDLDDPASLSSATLDWDVLMHFAPPGDTAERDERTRNLISVFENAGLRPRKLLYVSTSGVYGDCGGAQIDEAHPLRPQSARARRRVDAENALAAWGVPHIVLRVPGIYAADRLPIERLKRGTAVLRPEEDVYTNHIHAEDLAAICARALDYALPGAIYNISDDSVLRMGDWFDLVADRNALPRPRRISRAEAEQNLPTNLLSFMRESRILVNTRMKKELGVELIYSTVYEGVPDQSRPI